MILLNENFSLCFDTDWNVISHSLMTKSVSSADTVLKYDYEMTKTGLLSVNLWFSGDK